METKLPEEVVEICKKIESKGFEVYIVGGAVRDLLMGKLSNDWDFTTNAKPEDIQKLFKDSFYDNKYGTVGIKSENFKPHEITTYRTEHGYGDPGGPDKFFGEKFLWGRR